MHKVNEESLKKGKDWKKIISNTYFIMNLHSEYIKNSYNKIKVQLKTGNKIVQIL